MNVAVLCPGPSLPRFWRDNTGYAIVIGVNTAGWRYAVDWLAFSDRHVLEGLTTMPRLGFITNAGHDLPQDKLRLDLPLQGELEPELAALAARQDMTACAWTFPNALAVANQLAGDSEVHVFGFDCAEVPADFAGQEGEHGAMRWALELPWIRSQWRPTTKVFSDLPDRIRATLP